MDQFDNAVHSQPEQNRTLRLLLGGEVDRVEKGAHQIGLLEVNEHKRHSPLVIVAYNQTCNIDE